MTDSRMTDELLRHLAAIVEWAGDPIIGINLDGTIISCNRAAEQAYGFQASEAIGRPFSVLIPPEQQHELPALLERVRRGEPIRRQRSLRAAKSGSAVPVEATISPIRDESGGVTGASVIDRRAPTASPAGAEPGQDTPVPTPPDGVLDGDDRIQSFLADAAHQLRSPITGIQACAEALLRGPAEEEERDRLLANVVRAAARASRLITSLLRLARLDRSNVIDPEACDLIALCADEADRIWTLAPRLDIALRAIDPPPGPTMLDAVAVREIVSNLLDNARRHAAGVIEVLVEGGEDLTVRVRDDGPGVPEGLEEQIFERFVTLDAKGGSGLGLAIGRELARAHGGDLTYEEGGFLLRLPLVEVPEPDPGSE